MATLPTGTVSFLFTDIEGSSLLWERDRPAMARAAARHDALVAAAIAGHDGVLFKHVGDMVQAAFHTPADAIAAAVDAQRALAAEPWLETGPLRARMAIHLGAATPDARGDYNQIACLNRLSRLLSAGHGGQTLLTDVVRQAAGDALPHAIALRDLGQHRLRDLLEPERVWQVVIDGLPAGFPPLRSLEAHATNLPALPTALLGRDAELAELAALLDEGGPRLVTLVGPGGVGKTRLALQAAANALEKHPDGVWLVRLSDVTDPAMVVPEIAATLGVRESGGLALREALAPWIGSKRILIVLDTLEQVISGAPEIADLLAACPHVRVLATSRQRLGIGWERAVPVQPLPLSLDAALATARTSPAVQLFVERAREVMPEFALDERNAATITAICAKLDGLPLALELAAAQLRTRTLPELLADLEQRFDLLVGGRRDAPAHQQSLAATIAWSYERLEVDTQQLLRLLSTFAGGWSREAATAIASDMADVPARLGTLSEQSLVRREVVEGEVSRWSMLESIRAFGRSRMEEAGEETLARERHAAWCLAFAEEAAMHLEGAEQADWLARLDREHDNARAALQWWTSAGEPDEALALATALAIYWQARGYLSEGRRWLAAALGQADAGTATGLRAMIEAGILAQEQGDYAGAGDWFTQALQVSRHLVDRGREAMILNNLGTLAIEQGNLAQAEDLLNESLSLATHIGDQRRRAQALGNLATIAHYRADTALALNRSLECLAIWRELDNHRGIADMLLSVLFLLSAEQTQLGRARAAGEESLRRFREFGDPRGEALALTGLGLITAREGDLAQAASLHEESLKLARQIEDRGTEARALGNLGGVELDRGNVDRAEQLLTQALLLCERLGDQDGIALGIEMIAALRDVQGDAERAARLFGAAAAMRDALTIPIPPESRARHARTQERIAQVLGDRFDHHFTAGASLSPDDAIREAQQRGPLSPASTSLAHSLQTLDDLLGVSAPGNARPRNRP